MAQAPLKGGTLYYNGKNTDIEVSHRCKSQLCLLLRLTLVKFLTCLLSYEFVVRYK